MQPQLFYKTLFASDVNMVRDSLPEESEQNVYGDGAREDLMENSEISPEEEAFMQGYEEAEKEEEDATSEAYEQAFATPKKRKRAKQEDPLEEEELEGGY